MDCPVCFNSNENLVYRRLPCHPTHIFCSSCLNKVYKLRSYTKKGNFPCPLCKMDINWGENGIESFKIVQWILTPEEDLKRKLENILVELKIAHKKQLREIEKDGENLMEIMDNKLKILQEKINSYYYEKRLKFLNLMEEINELEQKKLSWNTKIKSLIKITNELTNIKTEKMISLTNLQLSVDTLFKN